MQKGFTLLELLVVIVIIGILSSVVLMNTISGAARARDSKRVQEVYQIANVLHQYYAEKREFPDNTDSGDDGCWDNWDGGSSLNGQSDPFIQPLIDEGFTFFLPKEEIQTGESNWEKCSYRYQKTSNLCGGNCTGTYAVVYATCETDKCPTDEWPACCAGDPENGPSWDSRDVAVFLKEE